MEPSKDDSEVHWFAVQVKPQHERTANFALQTKGFETYLPLYRDRRRWSDRMKELDAPLFPGYVFCRFPRARRTPLLATPSVQRVVSFGNGPVPVPDSEIESIRILINSGKPIKRGPCLRAGQKVRIERGPLAGIEGTLVQERNTWRVVISVELLQRSVSTEIERDSVVAIH